MEVLHAVAQAWPSWRAMTLLALPALIASWNGRSGLCGAHKGEKHCGAHKDEKLKTQAVHYIADTAHASHGFVDMQCEATAGPSLWDAGGLDIDDAVP